MGLDFIRVKLVSSNIALRLQYIADHGIVLRDVSQLDELTVLFTLRRNELKPLREYFDLKGDKLATVRYWGPGSVFAHIVKRPILVAAVSLLIFLTLWLPGRVLFVQVEGNSRLSKQEILYFAETAGIRFGQKVKAVRSEKVKNNLLKSIPELGWVGVNTRGCVATISVSERQLEEPAQWNPFAVSSLVSARDALVTYVTVTAGNPLCQPGDTVAKGQILISGFTDCGIKIQATKAEGEVFGRTEYEKQLIFPCNYQMKNRILGKSRNIYLQIGKKEIKIWKGSGIPGIICDKMYKTHYLTLPGGFVLPIGIKMETCVYYNTCKDTISPQKAQPVMEQLSRYYLLKEMISGEILSQQESFTQADGAYLMTGNYSCQEMIGRIYNEKIGAYHEQDNRKDRKR